MSNRYQGGFLTASYFPLQVPDAPTIGTATGASSSLSVTFTAPTNVGGGAITSYLAIATDTSSGATFTGTGASSPVTVSGLTNGNSYTVKVAAVNAYGTGPLSAASNSVIPAPGAPSSVEYLVIAGGGGAYTGAGGAGGFRTVSGFAVASGSPITVTVGAGGVGAGSSANGSNSVFSTITSLGGGGTTFDGVGKSGGSGGGGDAAVASTAGGAGTVGQGNNGGTGFGGSPYAGGGGGGAGAVGGNAPNSSTGGNGGNGSASSITGSSVTYAGGGGGGVYSGGTAGSGGSGGGGAGGTTGVSGTTNSGGGGGGGDGRNGGNGGSGIVVIRYADSFTAATATTGSPTITVAGGYRIYQWTSSGSITF